MDKLNGAMGTGVAGRFSLLMLEDAAFDVRSHAGVERPVPAPQNIEMPLDGRLGIWGFLPGFHSPEHPTIA
jgi:hypothetical protein